MSLEAIENRLVSLESRFAFQDRLLQELSEVLAKQQRIIDDSLKHIKELELQVAPLVGVERTLEKPPHY